MNDLSNQIYEAIEDNINNVIQQLSTQQIAEQLKDGVSKVKKNLEDINDELQNELQQLKLNSEWKRFTIAFYGETNAGKSTLIEALRIHLGEGTKLESQQKFKDIQVKLGLTEEAFDNIRSNLINIEQDIEASNQEINVSSQKFSQLILQAELAINQEENNSNQELNKLSIQHIKVINELNLKINELNFFLIKLKADKKWWQKIVLLIAPPPEKKQLAEIMSYLVDIKNQHKIEKNNLIKHHQMLKQQAENALIVLQEKKLKELALLNNEKNELENKKNNIQIEKKRLDNEAKKLVEFSDGKIIGDGRSDFTKVNAFFDFELGGQSFSLIDVPGIEGNESIVNGPIEDAVRKAHAVFYVTRTPRPPQTSDGSEHNCKGTLEKIKDHLGAQSEVWSIYNHPVNNPRQLTSPLLNEDNRNSLVAMDEKLKLELKDQYCGNIVISARSAYLALVECIVPGSKDASEKRKFFNNFGNSQAILSLSGLTNFITILQTTIIGDYRKKILRSNLNKAYKVLEFSLDKLNEQQTSFITLKEKLNEEVSNAKSKIKICLEELVGNLNSLSSKIRQNFYHNAQEEIYKEIDSNINNDEFKRKLKTILEEEADKIENNLQQQIEKQADEFGKKVNDIIDRSAQHLKNIVSMQNNNFTFNADFNLNLNIDNGVKLGGLLASGAAAIAGVAFLASNPVGWSMAFVGGVLALLGSLVGVAKATFGLFSPKYKQSQQRKGADEALRNAKKSLEGNINRIINEIKIAMSGEVNKIEAILDEPIKQCTTIYLSLEQAYGELDNIARNIKYQTE